MLPFFSGLHQSEMRTEYFRRKILPLWNDRVKELKDTHLKTPLNLTALEERGKVRGCGIEVRGVHGVEVRGVVYGMCGSDINCKILHGVYWIPLTYGFHSHQPPPLSSTSLSPTSSPLTYLFLHLNLMHLPPPSPISSPLTHLPPPPLPPLRSLLFPTLHHHFYPHLFLSDPSI